MDRKLKFTRTDGYYMEYSTFVMQRNQKMTEFFLSLGLCAVALFFVLNAEQMPQRYLAVTLVILISGALLCLLGGVLMALYPRRIQRFLNTEAAESVLGAVTMWCEEDTFFYENGLREEAPVSYDSIKRIDASKSLLLLKESTTKAFYIPREAFESAAEAAQLVSLFLARSGCTIHRDNVTRFLQQLPQE